jgi:hypothetical protein
MIKTPTEMTKLSFDYGSSNNNDTVALYLRHPDVASQGKHIGRGLRRFYLEGFAAARGFGIRVRMGSGAIGFAMAQTDVRPAIFDKLHRPDGWDTKLSVLFAGLIDGAEPEEAAPSWLQSPPRARKAKFSPDPAAA